MEIKAHIEDLLDRWEEAQEKGEPLTAEELCQSCPELLEEVRRKIEALRAVDQQLDLPPVAGAAPYHGTANDADETKGQRIFAADADDDRTLTGAETEFSLDFLTPSDQPGILGKIGPYEVQSVVGHGGMGIVLMAADTKLRRSVAVKVIAPQLAPSPLARKRFLREAQAAAAVVHPHVVTIHAVDEDRVPYLVMEYVNGISLQKKIENEGALGLKEILRIGSQVAAGLAAAHKQGLIHRDIKPANILLENGVERVKITDFGLARAADDLTMTRTGDVTGTPQFMSPEQGLGQAVDHRSDLFSLGSVLYTMCTGKAPFRGTNSVQTIRQVCDEQPKPIRQLNPDIPEWMVEIVDKLLEKKPEQRIQTAAEVAELFERHLAHIQDPAHSLPSLSIRRSWSDGLVEHLRSQWSSRGFKIGAGIAGVLAVAAVIGNWSGGTRERTSPESKPSGEAVAIKPPATPEIPIPVESALHSHAAPAATAPFDAEKAKSHQETWAGQLGIPVEVPNSLGMRFRLIPAGEFQMGTAAPKIETLRASEPNEFFKEWYRLEGPQRHVTINAPFYLAAHEVTQREYLEVMGVNPSLNEPAKYPAGAEVALFPVNQVTWFEAIEFCNRLSLREGISPRYARTGDTVAIVSVAGYRLANEAEWEYACRAGSETDWYSGDDASHLNDYAWSAANSGIRPHSVGERQPNSWGLLDMHGNVWEWCEDSLVDFHNHKIWTAPAPFGQVAEERRLLRGGAFLDPPTLLRSAVRAAFGLRNLRNHHVGFRVAASIDTIRQVQQLKRRKSPSEIAGDTERDRRAAEWALSLGGAVVLSTGERIASATLLPAGPFRVVEVRFPEGQKSVKDEGLQHLRDLPALEHLYLRGTSITDAGLKHLRNLTTLRTLVLHATHISDAGLENLQEITELTHLDLGYNRRITSKGLPFLRNLTDLRLLCFFATSVDDEGLSVVGTMHRLEYLEIHATRVTDVGLRQLGELKLLKTIVISPVLSDQALAPLRAAAPGCEVIRR